MKTRPLICVILFIVLQTVSTGCGNLSSPPTATPSPSNTAIPISTSTPTQIPTETPTPIVEKDLQPAAYTDTLTQAYMNVEINLSLITDKSMDSYNPSLDKIYINPYFNNHEGENSKVALAHFTALAFYRAWQFHQNTSQPTSDTDFESYLQLWSQAQQSNNPTDWEKVQINGIWANDLNDGNGYNQQEYTIWPMYTGDSAQVPEEVRAINEIGVVFGRFRSLKNSITIFSSNQAGLGTNLDDNKIYIYYGLGPNPNTDFGGWNATGILQSAMAWFIYNKGGSSFPTKNIDRALYLVINGNTNIGSCCFRAALKIDPPTKAENRYNP